MCPMQCRTNGININETPKYQSKSPDESIHYLPVKYPSDKESGMLTIPLQLSVVTSYLEVRKPKNTEWEDDSITKI